MVKWVTLNLSHLLPHQRNTAWGQSVHLMEDRQTSESLALRSPDPTIIVIESSDMSCYMMSLCESILFVCDNINNIYD